MNSELPVIGIRRIPPFMPRLFIYKVNGVIKARIGDFYGLAGYFTPVKSLRAGMKLSHNRAVIEILTHARIGLILFTRDKWHKAYLPSAHKEATWMSKFIDEHFLKLSATTPWDETLDASKIEALQGQLEHFEIVLHDELGKLPVFILEDERLGNLSVDKLLTAAHKGYSPSAVSVLNDLCKSEIDEAGRCLAYERATASGFHILRSVEILIKQYLLKVPNFVMPPLNRQNWGQYIKLLSDNGASKEVVDTIQGIKDNHRNPLMHPEDTLELSDAIDLMAICQSMSEALVRDMKKRGFA